MDGRDRSGTSLLLVAIWVLFLTSGVGADAGAESESVLAAVKMAGGDQVRCPFSQTSSESRLTVCLQIDFQQGFIQAIEPEQIHLETEDFSFKNVSFPDTPRHESERKKLLGRLKRKPDDKWSSSHVRHRTLDALYAYSKYYPRQMEEINRLKGLYDKVTGPQRAVSYTTHWSRVFHWVHAELSELTH